MSKEKSQTSKEAKKQPVMTLKEKRAAKHAKKNNAGVVPSTPG